MATANAGAGAWRLSAGGWPASDVDDQPPPTARHAARSVHGHADGSVRGRRVRRCKRIPLHRTTTITPEKRGGLARSLPRHKHSDTWQREPAHVHPPRASTASIHRTAHSGHRGVNVPGTSACRVLDDSYTTSTSTSTTTAAPHSTWHAHPDPSLRRFRPHTCDLLAGATPSSQPPI